MNALVRKEFVKRVLREEGMAIQKEQVAAIDKLLQYRSGRLREHREHTVDIPDEMDGILSFRHPDYERFLDIKKKNRTSSNVENWRRRRKRKPKAYPIHNRIIFGRFNRIAYKLMHYLTDETARAIKQELDNQTI